MPNSVRYWDKTDNDGYKKLSTDFVKVIYWYLGDVWRVLKRKRVFEVKKYLKTKWRLKDKFDI